MQALKKQLDRGSPEFTGIPKTQEAAENLIDQILRSNPKLNVDSKGRKIFTDQNTGRATIRFNISGEFDTFLRGGRRSR